MSSELFLFLSSRCKALFLEKRSVFDIMGQTLSILGSKEFFDDEESKITGSSAFDILFAKNVPHILEMIFFSLDYESYNKCLEVNNTWKQLLTSESYHKKGKIVFSQELIDLEKKLMQASSDGNVLKVRQVISCRMVNVNCLLRDVDRIQIAHTWIHRMKKTPLHEAASGGHQEVVKVLLDGGGDPYMEDASGRTALGLALIYSQEDVIRLLIKRGTDPNEPNTRGDTPLHISAMYGFSERRIKLLLELGADINKANEDGNTTLHLAARRGSATIVKYLLQSGADHTKENEAGQTPLSYARLGRESMLGINVGDFDTVRILLQGWAK